MKTSPFPLLTVYCTLMCATAFAQIPSATTAPPPLPPGPLIQKRAPDPSKWVITIVSAPVGNSSSAAGATSTNSSPSSQNADNKTKVALEVTMTKAGKIMLREVRNENGTVVPTWCVDGLQITISGGTSIVQAKLINVDPTVPTPNYEDYSDSDFQGFDWISTANYTGIKEIEGKKCIVYQDTLKNDSTTPVAIIAYVDLSTRLPVQLNVGGGIRNYVFKDPPGSKLVLPQPVAQLLKNRQREMDSATPRS